MIDTLSGQYPFDLFPHYQLFVKCDYFAMIYVLSVYCCSNLIYPQLNLLVFRILQGGVAVTEEGVIPNHFI